jgi:hypothetical protein
MRLLPPAQARRYVLEQAGLTGNESDEATDLMEAHSVFSLDEECAYTCACWHGRWL